MKYTKAVPRDWATVRWDLNPKPIKDEHGVWRCSEECCHYISSDGWNAYEPDRCKMTNAICEGVKEGHIFNSVWATACEPKILERLGKLKELRNAALDLLMVIEAPTFPQGKEKLKRFNELIAKC